jgi:hypothetical protein
MGDVEAIRFLCMEVGCTEKASWEWSLANAKQPGKHLYADTLDHQKTKEGDTESGRFSSKQLRAWDQRLCARLDCADRFGNTPAHMAVFAHKTMDMFRYLHSLYADGAWGHCAAPQSKRMLASRPNPP